MFSWEVCVVLLRKTLKDCYQTAANFNRLYCFQMSAMKLLWDASRVKEMVFCLIMLVVLKKENLLIIALQSCADVISFVLWLRKKTHLLNTLGESHSAACLLHTPSSKQCRLIPAVVQCIQPSALASISFSEVFLINWQLSVCRNLSSQICPTAYFKLFPLRWWSVLLHFILEQEKDLPCSCSLAGVGVHRVFNGTEIEHYKSIMLTVKLYDAVFSMFWMYCHKVLHINYYDFLSIVNWLQLLWPGPDQTVWFANCLFCWSLQFRQPLNYL